jgi:hypothetical protein
MILHILQMSYGETREEVPMDVMIQQPAARETERMQAHREELVERVARACAGYFSYPSAQSGLEEHISKSLAACRFPRGRVQSKCIHLLIFKRGNVHCAGDSFLHQTADKPLPSVASPPLHKLDQTGHCHLSHGGDADRSCQKQVRTRGRKRTPA